MATDRELLEAVAIELQIRSARLSDETRKLRPRNGYWLETKVHYQQRAAVLYAKARAVAAAAQQIGDLQRLFDSTEGSDG